MYVLERERDTGLPRQDGLVLGVFFFGCCYCCKTTKAAAFSALPQPLFRGADTLYQTNSLPGSSHSPPPTTTGF